ncbi:PIN domain-containing protein [Chelatococcus sp. GCM10030263]|uniref:PIN domain-containing protein n=1 Tax=Chelatococcus sp. GCM10030263 TaxID=3273387 RepID=UPI0036168FB8
MIGLDTNVLLRIFSSDDDAAQVSAAQKLLRDQSPVFIGPVVLAEFAWTLKQTYKLDRAAIHRRLQGVVQAPEFVVPFPEATERAVELYGIGPADFADYLIAEMNLAAGCTTTVTFDRDAAKCPSFTSLD